MEKNKNLAIGIIIALVVVVLATVIFMFQKPSAKTVFLKAIQGEVKTAQSKSQEKQEVKSTVNVELEGEKVVDNLELHMVADISGDTKKGSMTFSLANQNLGTLNVALKGKQGFINIPELFDYFIEVEVDADYENTFDNKNGKIILNAMSEALTKSIKDEYLSVNKETNDEKVKQIITLDINDKNKETFFKTYAETLKNNKELIDLLVEQTKSTKEEIIKDLDEVDYSIVPAFKVMVAVDKNNKFVSITFDIEGGKLILTKLDSAKIEIKLEVETLKVSVTFEEINPIKKEIPEIKDVKKVDELTEEDQTKIMENLEKSTLVQFLRDVVGTTFESDPYDSYDYNYDYDYGY